MTIRSKGDILSEHCKINGKEAHTMLKNFVFESGKKQNFEGFLCAFGVD